MPAVLHKLTQIFHGCKICQTLNTAESVAQGCALLGAHRSVHFKVKPVQLSQQLSHAIKLRWVSKGKPEGTRIIPAGDCG